MFVVPEQYDINPTIIMCTHYSWFMISGEHCNWVDFWIGNELQPRHHVVLCWLCFIDYVILLSHGKYTFFWGTVCIARDVN